ncbi:mannose-P-dolichol utilization defect 1 protein homolog 1-like [Teleopsis dalmanni]|uniref:mannose-P-dolichol utilization defect 1 protein homolog 1-like n=1 Tax=Teleopsis dalmanni TaxID=139649 RepID=UPI0018CEA94A|nr:mannose-P-dolichol utilization defect 1 protein homolog 1-like [Teleopsis dalmanni]
MSTEGLSSVIANYFDKGIILVIADLLSLITVSSCLVIKVPQINTIRENKSSKGISVNGLCLELFSYTVMMSYNYSSGYEFLSYMEYVLLLIQEYVLIYYTFKYQNLLGQKTKIMTVVYIIIATLIYFKIFPVIILTFLVVIRQQHTQQNMQQQQGFLAQKDILTWFRKIKCLDKDHDATAFIASVEAVMELCLSDNHQLMKLAMTIIIN